MHTATLTISQTLAAFDACRAANDMDAAEKAGQTILENWPNDYVALDRVGAALCEGGADITGLACIDAACRAHQLKRSPDAAGSLSSLRMSTSTILSRGPTSDVAKSAVCDAFHRHGPHHPAPSRSTMMCASFTHGSR